MKLINEIELAQLLKDSERLRRLESNGVSNWEGYNIAIDNSFIDWTNNSLDKLMMEYYNYVSPEIDDCDFFD